MLALLDTCGVNFNLQVSTVTILLCMYMQSFQDILTIARDGTDVQADCDYQAPNNCTGFVPTDCCDRILGGSGVILSSSLVLMALCMALVLAML